MALITLIKTICGPVSLGMELSRCATVTSTGDPLWPLAITDGDLRALRYAAEEEPLHFQENAP
jgi:hypothetical protein